MPNTIVEQTYTMQYPETGQYQIAVWKSARHGWRRPTYRSLTMGHNNVERGGDNVIRFPSNGVTNC
jgi:hypothetical protein